MAVKLIALRHPDTGATANLPEHLVENAKKVGFQEVNAAAPEATTTVATNTTGSPEPVSRPRRGSHTTAANQEEQE